MAHPVKGATAWAVAVWRGYDGEERFWEVIPTTVRRYKPDAITAFEVYEQNAVRSFSPLRRKGVVKAVRVRVEPAGAE